MAVTTADGLVSVAMLSGIVLCWLGIHCYWSWDEPGVNAFAAVAVIFGLAGIGSGVIALALETTVRGDTVPLWADVALTGWVLAMVPWVVFALQYTGRYTNLRLRTVALISVPVIGIVTLLLLQSVSGQTPITQVAGSLMLLYVFSLVTVGSYLLLRTTFQYGHLSTFQGISLTLGGFAPLVIINSLGPLTGETAETVIFGVYTLTFVIPTVAFSLAVFRYGMFDSTPAAGALGEQAISRETDDLVFVVDQKGRIIKINETATETLDLSQTEPLGEPFASLVGQPVDAMRETDTVELETTVGTRKFDPQVSAFTDQYDRELGSLLSLRDVTERELRKQRLEVLNRVLRHNLRNRVDVIKSYTEAIDGDSELTAGIQKSADGLAALSSKARSIDQLVSEQTRWSEVNLAAVVRELVDEIGEESITMNVPETASLVTDHEALRSALESAIENAVEHAATSVIVTVEETTDEYEIFVADDGPGIPNSELESLDAETETPLQHGTGLGLWQLKWSMTKLNGTLSFDTSDGTTIRMTVPDQSD